MQVTINLIHQVKLQEVSLHTLCCLCILCYINSYSYLPCFSGAPGLLLLSHIPLFLLPLWVICVVQCSRDQESYCHGDRCRVPKDAPKNRIIAKKKIHTADSQWNTDMSDTTLILLTIELSHTGYNVCSMQYNIGQHWHLTFSGSGLNVYFNDQSIHCFSTWIDGTDVTYVKFLYSFFLLHFC